MKLTDTASRIAREFSSSVIGLSDASEAKLANIVRRHYPAPKVTVARINKAIKYLGLRLVANSRAGYYYFLNKAGDQIGDSVMVYRAAQLPLDRWIKEAENAIEYNRKKCS